MSRWLSIAGRKVVTGLAAFVLLFSMFANAFPTFAPDCCGGKMCPMHHKHPGPTNTPDSSHMDCEHGEMGLMPCSMSCGGPSEKAGPQPTVVFLPLGENGSVALVPVERAPLEDFGSFSDFSIRPLTPPPRFLVSL